MEKKMTSPAVKGVIISLFLIVFGLVIQFLNLSGNTSLASIPYIILFAGIVWSAISFAKQMNGNVTFGNIFAHAFKTAAAATAITIIFTIISINFISPEIKNITIERARSEMEARNLSDDQIDTQINLLTKYFVPMTAGLTMLFFLITGVIAALIGAAVSKKNPPQGPFAQQG